MARLTTIELCAGGGGQALGLELAGFEHKALVEIDSFACKTLKKNRPFWNVIETDLRNFSAFSYKGIDLLAAGLPCPPFSKAGKQLGDRDERNLFPEALRIVSECRPGAVMFENVRGLLDPIFEEYRTDLNNELKSLGYSGEWRLLNASDFGVPQLRPRAVFVATRDNHLANFNWPLPVGKSAHTVGEVLLEEMSSKGWRKAAEWKELANRIAPTLVGGSKKHGGPDLGPTRAKKAWASLGVDGHGLADEPPAELFEGKPRLTVRMAAILQGFPKDWEFVGGKTTAYRQVGNAFPPPVARAVGEAISDVLLQNKLLLAGASKEVA